MSLRIGASLSPKQLSIQSYKPILGKMPPVHLRFAQQAEEPTPKSGFWSRAAQWLLLAEMATLGVFGGVGYNIYKDSKAREQEMVARAQDKLPMEQAPEQWPANTKVYASTIQETSGYGDWFGFLYPRNLVSNLNDPEVTSLDAAHQRMEQGIPNWARGLNGIAQTAISSPTAAKGWNKNEHKPRFVLMIMGDAIGNERDMHPETLQERSRYDAAFMAEMSNVKSSLKENFKIPETHIKQLVRPDGAELVFAMEWLQEMQKAYPQSEALVYVVAHGMAEPDGRLPVALQDKQGAYDGFIGLNSVDDLTEWQMKYLFHKYLSKFKAVNLLMAPCHSGAWIAHSTPQKPGIITPDIAPLKQWA